jgi:hypothetical protein
LEREDVRVFCFSFVVFSVLVLMNHFAFHRVFSQITKKIRHRFSEVKVVLLHYCLKYYASLCTQNSSQKNKKSNAIWFPFCGLTKENEEQQQQPDPATDP